MPSRVLLGFPAVLLAGCSIIYNPDDLKTSDAPVFDAAIDAPADADPNVFNITGIEPTEIDEGVGAANGRPALFILQGTSLVGDVANVTVEILADDSGDAGIDGGTAMPPELVDFDIADSARQGGVAIRIPVLPDLREGSTATMRITVTQNSVPKMQDVTIVGHDELTLTAVNQLTNALYWEITVPGNLHFTGDNVIRLHATAGITIDGVIDGDAVGVNHGPHGCNGGASDTPGGCGTGGGTQGTNAALLGLGNGSGGGGGGFAAVASGGSGNMAGQGGGISGDPMLVPIDTVAGQFGNRGNGGGGGGAGLLNNAGGVGGGGGGVIYVRAGGDITVGNGGAIRAAGGNGTVAQGSGGGAGSGGALLVRSGASILSTTRWLSAPAGNPGAGTNPGGAGSVGRIRVDAAAGDVIAMANNPNAVRGPAWASTVPLTSTTAAFTALLRGQPQTTFGVALNADPAVDVPTGVGGTANVNVTLDPGKNTLCAVTAGSSNEEALTCVDVFYIGN